MLLLEHITHCYDELSDRMDSVLLYAWIGSFNKSMHGLVVYCLYSKPMIVFILNP